MSNSIDIKIEGDKELFIAFDSISKNLMSTTRKAVQSVNKEVIKDSRSNHRFTTRTGILNASIKQTKSKSSFGIKLDKNVSKYAKHIHQGFKSWKEDPFLFDAFERATNKKLYTNQIIKRINKFLHRIF